MLKPPITPLVAHSHGPSLANPTDIDNFFASLASPTSEHTSPFDTLLFAAASAAAPGMTRQHLQHSAWSGKSLQMPRSERLRLLAEGGTGAMTPPAEREDETEGEALGKGETEEVSAHGPLSARAHTPPTPPQLPEAKRARAATDVPPAELDEALQALPLLTTSTIIAKEEHAVVNGVNATVHAGAIPTPALEDEDVQVKCMARTRIPTAYGPVFLHVYHNNKDGKEHLAIVSDPAQLESTSSAPSQEAAYVPIRSHSLDSRWHAAETEQERITRGAYTARLSGSAAQAAPVPSSPLELQDAPLVRIHSECFTGETIGSLRCDCGEQLDSALSLIAHAPGRRGVVLYLRQEGRGIGLLEKVRAYNLQDLGMDTVQANLALGRGEDERTYGVAAAMLRDLGVGGQGIRLLTNNPGKVEAMRGEGVEVRERVGMIPRDWQVRGHTHLHAAAQALPPTAPHTPDLDLAAAVGPESAVLAGGQWEMRAKGATIVGGGVVRSEELERYLRTKVERMGHLLVLPAAALAGGKEL